MEQKNYKGEAAGHRPPPFLMPVALQTVGRTFDLSISDLSKVKLCCVDILLN